MDSDFKIGCKYLTNKIKIVHTNYLPRPILNNFVQDSVYHLGVFEKKVDKYSRSKKPLK